MPKSVSRPGTRFQLNQKISVQAASPKPSLGFITEDSGLPEAGRPESPVGKAQDKQDGFHTFLGAAAWHAKPEGHGAALYSCDFADIPRFRFHPCPPPPTPSLLRELPGAWHWFDSG